MWNPPIALTSEEQKIAARTRKTRKFFVFLREHRHEILDADFQHLLAQSSRQEPGGQEPVDAGLLALATLLQAYSPTATLECVAQNCTRRIAAFRSQETKGSGFLRTRKPL